MGLPFKSASQGRAKQNSHAHDFSGSRNQRHPHTRKLKGGHFGLAPEKSITLSVGESDVCKFRKDRPRTGPGTQQGRLYFVHQLTPVIINLGK